MTEMIIPTHPNNCIRYSKLAKILGLSYNELSTELGITFKRPNELIHLPFTNLSFEDNSK